MYVQVELQVLLKPVDQFPESKDTILRGDLLRSVPFVTVWHWRIKMLNFAAQANSLRIHLGGVPTTTKNILGNLPDLSYLWKKFSKNKHVTFFLKKYRFSFIWQSISSPNHIIISRHRHFNIFYQNPGAKNNLRIIFCISHCNIFPEKKCGFSLIWQSISSPNHIIISRHHHFKIFYQNPGAKNNLRRIFFSRTGEKCKLLQCDAWM